MITDYIFYKLHEQYSKQKWNDNPCSSAAWFLSIIQMMAIYCVAMFAQKVIPQFSFQNRTVVVIAYFSIAFLLYRIDYHYFKPRIETIYEKYKDHRANRWFRVWMLFPLLFFMVFLPFLLNSL